MLDKYNMETKLVEEPKIIKIGEKCKISINEYKKRLDTFYDVVLNNNGNEIFIGRYMKTDKELIVYYNNGKILVCNEEYISSINDKAITNVFDLYDIVDDIFYSVSSAEALEIFNPNLSSDFLKNKDKQIVRNDIEKKHRFKIKTKN